MDIVYAAEKSSIAAVLSDCLSDLVTPGDIEVQENPDETGSFLVCWRFNRYVVAPNGEVAADTLELAD